MKDNWLDIHEAICVYPDGSWRFPEEHRSWMGSDYELVDYGVVCEVHDIWAKWECPECLLATIDHKNLLEVTFFPHAGQSFNVEDQLVKAPNNEIWAVRDQQFKFKVRP